MRNNLTLNGGRNLQLLAQQVKFPFRFQHAQILKQRGRLRRDGFQDVLACARKVVGGGARVQVEQAQQRLILAPQRNRNDVANGVENHGFASYRGLFKRVGE